MRKSPTGFKPVPDTTTRKERHRAYRPAYAKQVFMVCQVFAATNEEVARYFEVPEETIEHWAATQRDFAYAMKRGKTLADAEVAPRFYRLAVGYRRKVTKAFLPDCAVEPVIVTMVEDVLPDRTAAIHWLRNRCPEHWGKVADMVYTDAQILESDGGLN